MERQAYDIAAGIENDHWWFSGRRRLLAAVLERHLPRSDAPRRILEIGCGNGGNLELLAGFESRLVPSFRLPFGPSVVACALLLLARDLPAVAYSYHGR